VSHTGLKYLGYETKAPDENEIKGSLRAVDSFLLLGTCYTVYLNKDFDKSFDLKQDIFLAMTKVLVALYTSNTSLTSDISACSTLSDICDLKTTYASTTIKEYYRLWVVCK